MIAIRKGKRRGFSLVESAICVVLVGGVMVASLTTMGASVAAQSQTALQAKAGLMALELLSEILSLPYEDPQGSASFGLEPDESGLSRAGFDDVDDYRSWSASPPQSLDGTVQAELADWEQVVSVARVDLNDLTLIRAAETGVKRISVTIKYKGKALASMTAIRANAAKTTVLGGPDPSQTE